MHQNKSVFITGASRGLGAALAKAYAAPGTALHLAARDPQGLAVTAEICRGLGAAVQCFPVNVTDRSAIESAIAAAHAQVPLDLIIANAGISGGTAHGTEGIDQVQAIFAVNLTGVIYTVTAALPFLLSNALKSKWRGQIAIIGSLAGLRGMPGAPAYSASKAAVKTWGEAMRIYLKPRGIAVTVVLPGFIKTTMTSHNDFYMPFLMDVDAAAGLIKQRLHTGPATIAFPWPMKIAAHLLSMMPDILADWLLGRMPKKG